jgi:hypothetical protein
LASTTIGTVVTSYGYNSHGLADSYSLGDPDTWSWTPPQAAALTGSNGDDDPHSWWLRKPYDPWVTSMGCRRSMPLKASRKRGFG